MIKQFESFAVLEFDTSESASLFKLFNDNKTRLEDFFPGTLAETRTLADTLNYCKLIQKRRNDRAYFPFIIIDQEDNSFIGYIDIKRIDWRIPKAEMGYFIDKQYEGKGIISKAMSYVLDYAVEKYKFKKILCRVGTQNIGSSMVALKNGFKLEGTIRADFKTSDGEIVDLDYYGRVF